MEYQDFRLLATDVETVKAEGKKRVTFQVQVAQSPAGELPEGVFTEYDAREMRQRLSDWENRTLEWADVIDLGQWLGTLLFPEAVRDLLESSLDLMHGQEKGLRIRLLLGGTLYNVPWEYVLLNRGGDEATVTDFLGLMPNVSMVRHQAATLPAWDVTAELPARMVMALASPSDYPSLNLDQERQYIEEAVKDNPHVDVSFIEDAERGDLLPSGEQAHLFHFAGHGDFKGHMGRKPGTIEGEGFIVLDDGYGDPDPFKAGDLAVILRQAKARVAVLGACRSGRRGDVNAWSSVAAGLLKGGLGAVVGMQYRVRDKSAIAFSTDFYRVLLSGLSVDEAVTAGRLAIARIEDVRGWGAPVLYLRAPDGIIFPEYTADKELEQVRQGLQMTIQQRITDVEGIARALRIRGPVQPGTYDVKMDVEKVGKGAEATAVDIESLSPGSFSRARDVNRGTQTETRNAGLACPKCQTPVEAGWKFCPNCRNELPAGPRFCHQCAEELAEGAKFCARCGTPVA